jgi:hypothetical protein
MPDNSCQTKVLQEIWGSGICKIEATAVISGKDVVLVIGGGTRPHIGAVSLALPRPSLADPSQVSSSASVLCVTGHKEDELARSAGLEMAAALDTTVTVIAGIHIDQATWPDILALSTNCEHVLKKLIYRIKELK